ncbi:MAG: hypothetical protein FWE29_00635 [Defluviitaleaceae bacterium]|nr:hypothetical protein [Defluviitaleaceae bacterium]
MFPFIAIIIATFILLLACTIVGLPIWYGLIVSFLMFTVLARKRNHSIKEIGLMTVGGLKKASIVVSVFVFIGMLSASWIVSGTVPYLVYYGVQIIHPSVFYAAAFLLCALVAFIIGTSFGTVAMVGVMLMAIAVSNNMNIYIASGAIISGIYFGDRASPMSSSLALLGAMCETEHYANVKMAFKTAIVPGVLTFLAFLALSFSSGFEAAASNTITDDISAEFVISHISLLPIGVILVLCLMKVNVRIAMFASSVVAWIVAFFVQSEGIIELLMVILFGFSLPETSPLTNIIRGGGILNMVNVAIIVALSCMIAGIIEKVGFIRITAGIENRDSRVMLFLKTSVAALISAAVGCNQSIAVIMSPALRKEYYFRAGLSNSELAKDVSVAAMIIPILIPWNIAVLVPVTTLGVSGIGYMPFILFAYLILIWRVFVCRFEDRGEKRLHKIAKIREMPLNLMLRSAIIKFGSLCRKKKDRRR